jgi:hypothetical protein
MKTIVREHPLRTIILDFDLSKTPPDFETEALQAYYGMHDKTWETRQNLLFRKDRLDELEVQINETEYSLLPIEQQLEFLEAGLQLTEPAELPLIEGSFSIDVGDFLRGVIEHHGRMHAVHRDLVTEWTWYNDWVNFIYDHEDWCDEKASKQIHEVFCRYKEVSIDIVSLDKDRDEFFGAHGEVRQLQEEYFEKAEQILEFYSQVSERAEQIYQRAEIIDQHLQSKGL